VFGRKEAAENVVSFNVCRIIVLSPIGLQVTLGLAAVLIFFYSSACNRSPVKIYMMKITTKAEKN